MIAYAALARRRIFRIDGTEAAGALAGLLFALEFIVLFESLRWTTAARSIVFLYAAPLFVALGAALLLKDERPRPIQWLGLTFAFAGVAIGLAGPGRGGGATIGDALALLAAALWGATTVLIKATSFRRADPVKTLLYQIGAATLISPFAAFAFGEPTPSHLSAWIWAAMVWQGVFVVGVTYVVWFWLLGRYPAAQLSAFTFITPLVGVFAGWLAFGDPVTGAFAVAIALVVSGLALVNWPRR